MDDVEGDVQSRQLRRLTVHAGIEPERLWLEHFRRGGDVGAVEVDAYLHQCLWLPRAERDLLADTAEVLAGGDASPGRPPPWPASEDDGTPV